MRQYRPRRVSTARGLQRLWRRRSERRRWSWSGHRSGEGRAESVDGTVRRAWAVRHGNLRGTTSNTHPGVLTVSCVSILIQRLAATALDRDCIARTTRDSGPMWRELYAYRSRDRATAREASSLANAPRDLDPRMRSSGCCPGRAPMRKIGISTRRDRPAMCGGAGLHATESRRCLIGAPRNLGRKSLVR